MYPDPVGGWIASWTLRSRRPLIGAAVGLKLTNVVYALGAAAAVLAASRPLLATLCLGLGGAVGAWRQAAHGG